MNETTDTPQRRFELGQILSITTGCLLASDGFDGVYEILNYLTGEDLFTHQLPRASEVCKPALLAEHPQLREVEVPDFDTSDHETALKAVNAFIAGLAEKFGATLPVAPLRLGDYKAMDPVREAGVMIGPEKVIPVVIDKGELR